MLQTFKDNKEEAINAETKAADDSKKLLEAKEEALSTAESALRAQAGENGARGESRAECAEEKKDLEDQNSRDEGYIADTKTACANKASEWDERKRVRAEEGPRGPELPRRGLHRGHEDRLREQGERVGRAEAGTRGRDLEHPAGDPCAALGRRARRLQELVGIPGLPPGEEGPGSLRPPRAPQTRGEPSARARGEGRRSACAHACAEDPRQGGRGSFRRCDGLSRRDDPRLEEGRRGGHGGEGDVRARALEEHPEGSGVLETDRHEYLCRRASHGVDCRQAEGDRWHRRGDQGPRGSEEGGDGTAEQGEGRVCRERRRRHEGDWARGELHEGS